MNKSGSWLHIGNPFSNQDVAAPGENYQHSGLPEQRFGRLSAIAEQVYPSPPSEHQPRSSSRIQRMKKPTTKNAMTDSKKSSYWQAQIDQQQTGVTMGKAASFGRSQNAQKFHETLKRRAAFAAMNAQTATTLKQKQEESNLQSTLKL